MKKLSFAAAAALALASAAPAVAQENTVAADPFVATQNDDTAIYVVGGITILALIAAGSDNNDSSSGTD